MPFEKLAVQQLKRDLKMIQLFNFIFNADTIDTS